MSCLFTQVLLGIRRGRSKEGSFNNLSLIYSVPLCDHRQCHRELNLSAGNVASAAFGGYTMWRHAKVKSLFTGFGWRFLVTRAFGLSVFRDMGYPFNV